MPIEDDNPTSYHHFRLFSYLAVTVLSISIIIGLFLVFQHLGETEDSSKSLANQKTLLENQRFLKNITENLQEHEKEELKVINERVEISTENGKKLDQILEILKSKP